MRLWRKRKAEPKAEAPVDTIQVVVTLRKTHSDPFPQGSVDTYEGGGITVSLNVGRPWKPGYNWQSMVMTPNRKGKILNGTATWDTTEAETVRQSIQKWVDHIEI